jgi:hypothetical protein
MRLDRRIAHDRDGRPGAFRARGRNTPAFVCHPEARLRAVGTLAARPFQASDARLAGRSQAGGNESRQSAVAWLSRARSAARALGVSVYTVRSRGLARFFARLQVAEAGKPLGLGVVLALAGPVEDPAVPSHLAQVVCACPVAPDQPEDLVREERQVISRHVTQAASRACADPAVRAVDGGPGQRERQDRVDRGDRVLREPSRPCSSPLKKMKRTLFVGWTPSAMICSAVSSTTPDCLMTQFDAERELAVAVRDMRPPIAANRT